MPGFPDLAALACYLLLALAVSAKLRHKWSPEQSSGWRKRTFPEEAHKQVSHETIYRSPFIQARGVLKKELLERLRAKHTVRRTKHASLKRNGLGQIKDAISISERPASVEHRAVRPGCRSDWVCYYKERRHKSYERFGWCRWRRL